MMLNKINLFLIFLLVSTIFSCGGSGGGDGGGGGGSSDGLRVFNGVLELPPLSVTTSAEGQVVHERSQYSFLSGYSSVSEGSQRFLARRVGGDLAIATQATATIEDGSANTFLIFGSRTLGIQSRIISDDLPDLEGSAGGLRVVHALIGAQSVRLRVDGVLVGAQSLFGNSSSFAALDSGVYSVQIERVVDGAIAWSGSVEVESERGTSLYITGNFGSLVLVRQG